MQAASPIVLQRKTVTNGLDKCNATWDKPDGQQPSRGQTRLKN